MVYKKLIACVLLCGATHSCMSMDLASRAMGATVDAVRSSFQTANEKMYPTLIFGKIHRKWDQADARKKVTLLHKLDRGFLDGHLNDPDLTHLLDSIEDTVPKYPICQQTLGLIHDHLATKLPTLEARSNIMLRAIKAMYLLSPDRLATDITNRKLLNNITDQTARETIVSIIAQSIIKAGNAGQANLLILALEKQAKEVPFGTTAQVTLKEFLGSTATDSYRSCEYIDSLGNSKEDTTLKQLAATFKAAQEIQAREEQTIKEQIKSIEQKNAQLRTTLEEQRKNAQHLQDVLGATLHETKRLEMQCATALAAKQIAEELLVEQQTAHNSNNEEIL